MMGVHDGQKKSHPKMARLLQGDGGDSTSIELLGGMPVGAVVMVGGMTTKRSNDFLGALPPASPP